MLQHRIHALLVLALAAPTTADVLDVDASAGPYYEVRNAVAAAFPGDIIRVRAGTYQFFGIIDKPLSVIAMEPGVIIAGGIRVQGIPEGEVAILDGLDVQPTASTGFILADCAGSVRVAGCSFARAYAVGPLGWTNFHAVRVERAGDVAFSECRVTNGPAFGNVAAPSSACRIEDSTVAWNDCILPALDGRPCSAESGGNGVVALRSDLLVQSCEIEGGRGDSLDTDFCTDFAHDECGDGGDAIVAIDSAVVVVGSSLEPGGGGFVGGFSGCWGGNGARVGLYGSSTLLEDMSDAPRLRASTALATEGQPVTFAIEGVADDLVYLLASTSAQTSVLPGTIGHLLIEAPNGGRRVLVGTLPQTGSLQWSYSAPQLPPLTHVALHIQAGHVRGGSALQLGPAHVLHLLDSGF